MPSDTLTTPHTPTRPPAQPLTGQAPPSAAGPVADDRPLRMPRAHAAPRGLQTARFVGRLLPFLFRARRELGETFCVQVVGRREPIILTSHPDHVRALFTAPADLVPSVTAESPLRPILGPNSVLTANGPRHMRQRRLLLPPFHGDAIARYAQAIERVVADEVDRWAPGETFATAPRMQAVTLGVIMAGVFGVEGEPAQGTPERGLRDATRRLLSLTEQPAWHAVELMNAGRPEPRGVLRLAMRNLDRHYLRTIAARRRVPPDRRAETSSRCCCPRPTRRADSSRTARCATSS